MRAELSEWKIAIDLPSEKAEAFSFSSYGCPLVFFSIVDVAKTDRRFPLLLLFFQTNEISRV